MKDTADTPKKRRRPRKPEDWRPAFLAALRDYGVVRYACEQAKVGFKTAYRHRADHDVFRAEWDEALEEACDLLELEARRRGVDGVDKPIYHEGVQIDNIKQYSDTLLIFLLKGARPHKFRDNHRHEVVGKDGGPVQVHVYLPENGRDASPRTD